LSENDLRGKRRKAFARRREKKKKKVFSTTLAGQLLERMDMIEESDRGAFDTPPSDQSVDDEYMARQEAMLDALVGGLLDF